MGAGVCLGFFVCGSGSVVCGVVCGDVLVVEGCLGEVVYVLERVLRGRLPGSVLRLGLGGLDAFLGLGGLGAVFTAGLLSGCSGWRSVGCFELCLRSCTQGSPHGALLHLMVASAALDYPSLHAS